MKVPYGQDHGIVENTSASGVEGVNAGGAGREKIENAY